MNNIVHTILHVLHASDMSHINSKCFIVDGVTDVHASINIHIILYFIVIVCLFYPTLAFIKFTYGNHYHLYNVYCSHMSLYVCMCLKILNIIPIVHQRPTRL